VRWSPAQSWETLQGCPQQLRQLREPRVVYQWALRRLDEEDLRQDL